MKKPVKLVLSAVVIMFLAYLAYSVYFTSKEGTESFSKFDVNNTASKNIKVEYVKEKGITPNQEGGVTFFVKDKEGVEKKVSLSKEPPPGIENSKFLTLTGHLEGDYFHASKAELY